MVGFQIMLILSGNLSFLNWLTVAPCIACFDDAALRYVFSSGKVDRVIALNASEDSSSFGYKVRHWLCGARRTLIPPAGNRALSSLELATLHQSAGQYLHKKQDDVSTPESPAIMGAMAESWLSRGLSLTRSLLHVAVLVLISYLSINPVMNMASKRQMMNYSFDNFHLVNTYGAFGSVGKVRNEIIIEGTMDANPDKAAWKPYEFKCKPGDVNRRPCVQAPYHHRLDWQIWFAAMGNYQHNPWLVHLIWKLLHNDTILLPLIGPNPFPDAPPRFIRARLFRYRFTLWKDAGPGAPWYTRTYVGEYLPPLSADNPSLKDFVQQMTAGS